MLGRWLEEPTHRGSLGQATAHYGGSQWLFHWQQHVLHLMMVSDTVVPSLREQNLWVYHLASAHRLHTVQRAYNNA